MQEARCALSTGLGSVKCTGAIGWVGTGVSVQSFFRAPKNGGVT